MHHHISHFPIHVNDRDRSSCDQKTEHVDLVDSAKMERLPCPSDDCISTHRDCKTVSVLRIKSDEDPASISRTLCSSCYTRLLCHDKRGVVFDR